MRTLPALARVALALVISVLAGVALAGLALPVVGGIGLISKRGADQFQPEKPPSLVLAQSTRILDRNGGVIATLFTENRVTVNLSQVPSMAQKALIAIEDNRFYEHKALDVKGTLRALALNSSSGSVQQGGSTLTQQYVKNLLIETANSPEGQRAAVQRSVKRKIAEARYAIYLEQHMTKDQILEGYLNIAYYGSGVYGIGAAARYFFSKRVGQLTLAQGAMLAGMVQNPTRFDPALHPAAAIRRRNVVLDRMLQLGIITHAQQLKSTRDGSGVMVTAVKSGCEAVAVKAPFFCDYVRRYLEDGPAGAALGSTRQARQERLLQGGLTIQTTLDPKIQQDAQSAVDGQVPRTDPSGVATVSDTVVPGTGEVRAMAVNRLFGTGKGQTKVNLALGGSVGFQGGSTFKAFVLAQALRSGIKPSLTMYAPPSYCPVAFKYQLADGSCPGNAGDSEAGTFDMAGATWDSVNTWFLKLEEKTGYDDPTLLAEALGVRQVNRTFEGDHIAHVASFVLGSAGGFSPLAMAGAYSTFAAQGRFCPPHPVTKITDSRGVAVPLPKIDCQQVLDPDVANTLTGILRGVIDGPARGRTGASASIGRPAAGKTGTTNSSKAAWFIGYTPQLATAVWVGKPVPTALTNITINGRGYRQVYGGTVPAAVWHQMMSAALTGVPVVDFPNAPLASSTSGLIPVPDVSRLTIAAATALLQGQGFTVAVGTAVNGAPIPAGSVVSTTPAVGTKVPAGTPITLLPSNGLAPLPTGAPTPPPVSPTPKPKPTHSPKPKPTLSPKPTATP